jgi:hypothetical protein
MGAGLIMGSSPFAGGGGGGSGGASIGSSVSGGTDGSVLFVQGGNLAQDNANFFWDDTDNQLVLGAGTASKPSLIFTDDTTGHYRGAANVLAMAISGVQALTLGGTGPDSDQTLAVGRCLIDSRTTDTANFSHRDMSAAGQVAIMQQAAGAVFINAASGQALSFQIAGSSKWRLNSSTFAFEPTGDNSTDFGATTSNRVRNIFAAGYWEGTEIADPAAPAADKGRLYFKDNGSAKTQLVVRFPTGAVQVIATEP